MGGPKFFSTDETYRLSRRVADAADIADKAGKQMPETLDGGPFAYLIKDMAEASAAQHVDMILRLRELAAQIEGAGDWYKSAAEHVEKLGDMLYAYSYDPTRLDPFDYPWDGQE